MFSALTRVVATLTLVGGGLAAGVGAAGATAANGWSAPVDLAPEATPVSVAMSDDGELAVVWQTQDGPRLAIRAAGGGWGSTRAIGHDAGPARAAYDGSGNLVVAWGENGGATPARVRVRVHTDSGWGQADTVAQRDRGGVGVRDLAVNASGTTLVAWQWEFRQNLKGLVTRGRAGGSWTTGLRAPRAVTIDVALGDGGHAAALVQHAVADPETSAAEELSWQVARQAPGQAWGHWKVLQRLTDVAPYWPGPGGVWVDAAGRTTASWGHLMPTGRWRIVAARAVPGSPWQAPVVLGRGGGTDFPVRVTGSQAGDVLVTYLRGVGNTSVMSVRWGSPGWSRPANVSGDVSHVNDWDAAMDPSGTAVALWTVSDGPGSLGRGVTAALMAADGNWAAPLRLSRAETPDGHARVVAMNHGEAAAAWNQSTGQQTGAGSVLRVRTHG